MTLSPRNTVLSAQGCVEALKGRKVCWTCGLRWEQEMYDGYWHPKHECAVCYKERVNRELKAFNRKFRI